MNDSFLNVLLGSLRNDVDWWGAQKEYYINERDAETYGTVVHETEARMAMYCDGKTEAYADVVRRIESMRDAYKDAFEGGGSPESDNLLESHSGQ